jgi:hypothetical protein
MSNLPRPTERAELEIWQDVHSVSVSLNNRKYSAFGADRRRYG